MQSPFSKFDTVPFGLLSPSALGSSFLKYSAGGVSPKFVADFSGDDRGGIELYRDANNVSSFYEVFDYNGPSLSTMFDRDGLLKWAPHNDLESTDDLTGPGWSTNNATVSPGTSGGQIVNEGVTPDGSAHGVQNVGNFTTGAAFTARVEAKLSTGERYLRIFGASPATWPGSAYFDLSAGVVALVSAGATASIEGPDEDGFYTCRVWAVAPASAVTNVRFDLSDGVDSTYAGDGTSGIELKNPALYRSDLGGMVNDPDTGSDYIENVTAASLYKARRNSHVNGVNRGILLEEARTNTLLWSREFDASKGWSAFGGSPSISKDQAVGPDGQTSLALVSANNGGYVQTSIGISAGDRVTASGFIRKGTAASPRLLVRDQTDPTQVSFVQIAWTGDVPSVDLLVTSGSYGYSVTDVRFVDYGGGLYRVELSVATAVSTSLKYEFNASFSGPGNTYFGFMQFEVGGFATSYIPTTGVATTRAAQQLSKPLTEIGYALEAGTIVCKHATDFESGALGFPRIWQISAPGDQTERISAFVREETSLLSSNVFTNSVFQGFVTLAGAYMPGVYVLHATAWAENDLRSAADGALVGEDASIDIRDPTQDAGRTQLDIGHGIGLNNANGHISLLTYFDQRLPDAALQEATA